MKYSNSSVFFTTLALSSVVVCASKVANEQGKSANTHSSSLWNYLGFGKKAQAVPVVEAKEDREESWSLVNEKVDSDDEYDLVLEEEIVTKEEIEDHRRAEEKHALERHDKARLARVRKAEEDEGLHAWAMPSQPKMSAKWYDQRAPVVLQREEAVMMTESEDEQHLEMFVAEEAIMVEDDVEDQQPVYEEEVPLASIVSADIPEAPLLEDDIVPVRAPLHADVEASQKPKNPNAFRGKTVLLGIGKSDESAASAEEASLIQRFNAEFQAAQSREGRMRVVNSMERVAKENPKFLEFHKLSVALLLKVNRDAIATDDENDSDEEEAYEFE